MRSPAPAIALFLALLAACSAPAVTATSGGPTATTPPVSVCLGGQEVDAGGMDIAGNGGSPGDRLASIDREGDESCERFRLLFEAVDGATPAGLGTVRAEIIEGAGVVRVHLPVKSTATTDLEVGSSLVDSVYVFREPDGNLAADFLLASAARAGIQRSGTDLSLSFEPGGEPPAGSPTVTNQTVVISPLPGTVGATFDVTGYARPFEATVNIVLQQDGATVLETVATANDWSETWGWFSASVESPVQGLATLFVGSYSPVDGSFEGAEVPLEVTSG
ncbi:MAG TPA: Gmad2 immunoglobulin-like domain-containing protein [Acidimicrobiia bacterium]|jgi:hypothetical protein